MMADRSGGFAMPTKMRNCRVCKKPLEWRELDAISGEEGSLALTVHRLPVLECDSGHRQFAYEDFPLLLLDHLVEQDAASLPASEAKGMLIKHYHCSACGEKLDSPAGRHTFHVDVTLDDVKPFDVELSLPVHRCTHCGREQIHSLKEVRSLTPAALAHAFKSAQIAAH
jgi:hypothetical protein